MHIFWRPKGGFERTPSNLPPRLRACFHMQILVQMQKLVTVIQMARYSTVDREIFAVEVFSRSDENKTREQIFCVYAHCEYSNREDSPNLRYDAACNKLVWRKGNLTCYIHDNSSSSTVAPDICCITRVSTRVH